jgi:hypothetical protein
MVGELKPYSYSGSDPINTLDPLGLIRIRRETRIVHDPSLDGIISDHGESGPVSFSLHAACSGEGECWRLEFSLFVLYEIRIGDPATLPHEEAHIDIFERHVYPILSTLLPYERRRYKSRAECESTAKAEIARVFKTIDPFTFSHVLHDRGTSILKYLFSRRR